MRTYKEIVKNYILIYTENHALFFSFVTPNLYQKRNAYTQKRPDRTNDRPDYCFAHNYLPIQYCLFIKY